MKQSNQFWVETESKSDICIRIRSLWIHHVLFFVPDTFTSPCIHWQPYWLPVLGIDDVDYMIPTVGWLILVDHLNVCTWGLPNRSYYSIEVRPWGIRLPEQTNWIRNLPNGHDMSWIYCQITCLLTFQTSAIESKGTGTRKEETLWNFVGRTQLSQLTTWTFCMLKILP